MPGPISPPAVPVARPPLTRSLSLDNIIGSMRLDNISNTADAVPCRLANTPGTHEQRANSLGITLARNVMQDGCSKLQSWTRRGELKALENTISKLGWGGPAVLGQKLQCHLTVLGAMRGGIAQQLRDVPGDETLTRSLRDIDRAIVQIGVRAGECNGEGRVTGAYNASGNSKALFDEIDRGSAVMLRCVRDIGGERLLQGIFTATVAPAMRDSIAERLPDVLHMFTRDGAPHLSEVLERRSYLTEEGVLQRGVAMGTIEGWLQVVLHLLKLPEDVLQPDRGSKGDRPPPSDRVKPADDLPRWARDIVGRGAPVAFNHAPVTVNNDLSKLLEDRRQPLSLLDVRNLVKDAQRWGQRLGQAQERLRAEKDRADRLQTELDQLKSTSTTSATGPDLTRKGAPSTHDQGIGTEQQLEDASTSTRDLDQFVRLDDTSPRVPEGSDRNHVSTRLDRLQRDTNDQGTDNLVRNTDGNGNCGPRNDPPSPDNNTDNTTRPVRRADTVELQFNETTRDLNPTNRNRLQRLGDTEQRLQRNDEVNRPGSSRNPAQGGDVLGEYVRYLEALNILENRRPTIDPARPKGPRGIFQERSEAAERGIPDDVRTLKATDFVKYRDERGRNTATPHVPFMEPKGRLPQLPTSKGEFAELIERFGRGRVSPSIVIKESSRSPAPPSIPKAPSVKTRTEIEIADFISRSEVLSPAEPQRNEARQRVGLEQTVLLSPRLVTQAARDLDSSVSSTPLLAPSPPTERRNASRGEFSLPAGLRIRSGTPASTVSENGRGSSADEVRKAILKGSRRSSGEVSSRPELQRQVRFEDRVEQERGGDTFIVDTKSEWQRTFPGESEDSGNDSPTRLSGDHWETQPAVRVADQPEVTSAHKVQLNAVIQQLRERRARQSEANEIASAQPKLQVAL